MIHSFLKTCAYMLAWILAGGRAAPAQGAAVLMYHSIGRSGWKLAVTPEAFERQMRYLKAKKSPVSLADIVAYAKIGRGLPHSAVAVTFDDGYRDALTEALPILEKYGIPATVFVPSDLGAETGPEGLARLSKDELRELAHSPLITIGSHAHAHRKFTELAPAERSAEARESAYELSELISAPVRFFAYPFGARDADSEQAVVEAGYASAFGITEGFVEEGSPLFRLPRIQIDSRMNQLLFRLRLTPALTRYRRFARMFGHG